MRVLAAKLLNAKYLHKTYRAMHKIRYILLRIHILRKDIPWLHYVGIMLSRD